MYEFVQNDLYKMYEYYINKQMSIVALFVYLT